MKPYYEADGITIYHGDCRDVLPTIRADVLVTDPPYGIDFAAQPTKWQRRAGQQPEHWDSSTKHADYWPASDARTPLPVYADREEMRGRLRAFRPAKDIAFDRDGHDPGDEDVQR